MKHWKTLPNQTLNMFLRKKWMGFTTAPLLFSVYCEGHFPEVLALMCHLLLGAILLIFDTSKILTTVSFWGFSVIPQLDSHGVAGGSLWFPHLLAARPGRSGAGSGWPLTLWNWVWAFCGSYLGFHPCSLQQTVTWNSAVCKECIVIL